MKKLFLIGTLLCVLCSCGSGGSGSSGSSGSSENAGPANVHEGHEWVDLGLPSGLKWATCNVGASSPEDNGDHYAWGDLKPMTDQYRGTTCREKINISGNPQYDVVRAKWGGSWRMPTKEEFEELKNNCTWEWTTNGGHNGYKVSGSNGNSIFLPASGSLSGFDLSLNTVGTYGFYRSASPCSDYEGFDGYNLLINEYGEVDPSHSSRNPNGYSVRGVME